MEGCGKLTEARKEVGKRDMEEWWTRHSRDKKKQKEDVEGGKRKKERGGGEVSSCCYPGPFFFPLFLFPASALSCSSTQATSYD